MVRAADIRDLRRAADDYDETEELKRTLRRLKANRPFCLGEEMLDNIFRWKLRTQYGRQKAMRDQNTDVTYCTVTRAAFEIEDNNRPDYEARLRFALLCALPGVGVPVASAILALAEPDKYCVIDFRGWRAVFGEQRSTFGIPQYLKYREKVRTLADELRWSIQETDLALWEWDRRKHMSSG